MKILFHIFFFVSHFLMGQIPKFKIDSVLHMKMEKYNVEEIGFTRKSCTGYGVNSVGYLFFKIDSGTLMQKIEFIEYPKEDLKEYEPIFIKDDFFFDYLIYNQQEILSDKEIKRFQLDVKETDSDNVNTGFPLISHSCYRHIFIQTQESIISIEFDYFNLVKSLKNSREQLNINFDFNDNLNTIKWDKLINSNIDRIEERRKLKLITSKQ